ncbi:hypothetical protein [Joostella sp. CR20]|uniref:hypothetical protein n=1 Tax=Joostella sp. CR20 TaxID=2804312 RepID=UPI00313E6741
MNIILTPAYEVIKSKYENQVKDHLSALEGYSKKIASKQAEIDSVKNELNAEYADKSVSAERKERINSLLQKRDNLNKELRAIETEERNVIVSDDDINDVMRQMNL